MLSSRIVILTIICKVYKIVSEVLVSKWSLVKLKTGDIMYSMEGMKNCPLDVTSKLIGKKFTVLILRNMMSNQTRFNQFIESIEGVNPKTLSTRLKEMEKNGLICRKIYHETPIKIEYNLTEKGRELKSILDQMVMFSTKYCTKDVFKDGKRRTEEEITEILS
jgi:DNA-binding HxlR family transcriptional regulator